MGKVSCWALGELRHARKAKVTRPPICWAEVVWTQEWKGCGGGLPPEEDEEEEEEREALSAAEVTCAR